MAILSYVHEIQTVYNVVQMAMPWALKPHCLKPCFSFVGCWRRLIWTLWLSDTAFVGYKQTKRTDHRVAAGHEPVCFVHAEMAPTACALLEFTTAPLPILRVSGVVDIGITTTKSPALHIAALCLDSWPAAIFAQVLISDSCQRLHVSLQQTHYCRMILR